MGQIWFRNQPIEIEVVRSDRFCCPIALTIAVQNLCGALVKPFLKGQFLESDGNPKVVFICARQKYDLGPRKRTKDLE